MVSPSATAGLPKPRPVETDEQPELLPPPKIIEGPAKDKP
jgi:hypothetical protein